MTSQELMALDKAHVMQTYARYPVCIARGEGATLYDFEGKAYIDFASGIGVNSLGYGNTAWASAIYSQAKTLQHISNLFYSEPCVQVARRLTERTGMSAGFFANSGAESNEGAIKLARKYSFDKYGAGRSTILTLRNSFHGRTISTLAATGQDVFHNYFFPFTEGFQYTPANDAAALETACTPDVCAIMMELVQGEGGVLPLDSAFVQAAERLCRERDLLLIIDEVQTGVGRTGSLFAFQQYGIRPDLVTFAKGIAGGLPFGGVMANEKTRGVLGFGSHATTFGGNPVCAAGTIVVLDTLDDAMLQRIREKGAYLRQAIEDMHLACVTSVRGIGLMIGVGLQPGVSHKDMVAKLIANGLLALTAGSDTIRLLPPLTISQKEMDRGLEIFRNVLGGK